jgi:hypothetical protein
MTGVGALVSSSRGVSPSLSASLASLGARTCSGISVARFLLSSDKGRVSWPALITWTRERVIFHCCSYQMISSRPHYQTPSYI